MNTIRTLIGVSIVLLAIHPANAGGLIQKLPKDDTWVTYHVNWQLFGPGAEDSKGVGTWTVRSVGTETEKGQKCRYIEFELLFVLAGKTVARQLHKYLVPEEFLKPGQDPVKHAIRSWMKIDDGETWKYDQGVLRSNFTNWKFLPGPVKHTKINKKKKIAYQRGDLVCESAIHHQKKFVYDAHDFTIDFTVWKHKKVSFGAAAARIEVKEYDKKGKLQATWIYDLSLSDFGTGAESALPDAK